MTQGSRQAWTTMHSWVGGTQVIQWNVPDKPREDKRREFKHQNGYTQTHEV